MYVIKKSADRFIYFLIAGRRVAAGGLHFNRCISFLMTTIIGASSGDAFCSSEKLLPTFYADAAFEMEISDTKNKYIYNSRLA
jgi:hypothetical protein